MSKRLLCAATPTSGVRHRMMMLSWLKHFADSRGYKIRMLWGATTGVSFCRFEELFSPIPGIAVRNLSPHEMSEVIQSVKVKPHLRFEGASFKVFHPGSIPEGEFFSWDLHCAAQLSGSIPGRPPSIVVNPSSSIRAQTEELVRRFRIAERLGIRVRVEEYLYRNRKPHRTTKELNEVIRSISRIPWYTRVFVVTDSEYVQQMLASHFADAVYLRKDFDQKETSGRYVQRQDKYAMVTFLKEVECLCRCDKIINIGQFLNDHSVVKKTISEPYTQAAFMHLHRC